MQTTRIKNHKKIGLRKTIDLEVNHQDHNFYCEGLVTSNSHSYAYSSLAAKTVYLKYNYPKEFFLACLQFSEKEPEPMEAIAAIERELPDFGIKLLPPSLEHSDMDFKIEGDNIRYGIKSIKGIQDKRLQSIIDFRGEKFNNKFEVFDTAKQVKMPISILSALIQAGALEHKKSRSRLVLEAQAYNLLTDREKREIGMVAKDYDHDVLIAIADIIKTGRNNAQGKPIMKESRFETFKSKFQKYKDLYEENIKCQDLTQWWFENELLGYSYSKKLKDCFDEQGLITIKEAKNKDVGSSYKIVAKILEKRVRISKKDNRYLSLEMEDDEGRGYFLFMENESGRLQSFLDKNSLTKGDLVIVYGQTADDLFFVSKIKKVEKKVFTKIRDLKWKK